MAHTNTLPFVSLAFVPVARYPKEIQLPEPAMHVYYESRITDVDDELPKYNKWPSPLAILRVILRARMGRIRRA
jgi:hypothetical protein